MPRMYMGIAQEDRFPVVEIMEQTPEIPSNCQWMIFLRNHDELTLEMVTSKERDYMYNTYAADPQARINLGIRRRLSPLLDNDLDRIKLMNYLLLSMPGSPIIYYGDEIGMGDNVFIGDRNGVRTPMQWSPDRNAGFSHADPQRLYLTPIMDPIYGYQAVNVESQLRDPSSLLHWMRRMLAVRRTSQAFGRGSLTFLKPGNRKVLAYLREYGDDVILCVANLARSAQPVELDLTRYKGRVPVELLGRTPFPPISERPYLLTIAAHGFYWFRLSTDVPMPNWHTHLLPAEDRPVLVLFDGWWSLFREQVVPWRMGLATKTRTRFESEILPRYVEAQRWYAGKGVAVSRAALTDHVVWEHGEERWLLPLVDLEGPPQPARYFVPLALAWEERDEERTRTLATNAVARVRQQAQVGVMGDAFSDLNFCRAFLDAIAFATQLKTAQGALHFRPTAAYAALAGDDVRDLEIGAPTAQSSNTVVSIGERLLLKCYRRVVAGINPELEMSRYLTEVAHFPHCAPLAGSLQHVAADGTPTALALLQSYIPNQGDGWTHAVDYLTRHLELRRGATEPEAPDVHGAYAALMRTLGQRTAELHHALAAPHGDAAFDPEPYADGDLVADRRHVQEDVQTSLDLLQARAPQLPASARNAAQALLGQRAALHDLVGRANVLPRSLKTRHHGDYHLGQVLVTKNDFVIIDFEGEPARSMQERRAKRSPLRDVAGMLRSFDYAAHATLRAVAGKADEMEAMAPAAAHWRQQMRAAFLAGYRDAADGTTLVESLDAASILLALYELEKALYELRYELNSRPEWVDIPVQGLLDLLVGLP
jgi:maltose alpha-D-glucosyltransferase/alpha-amylase